METKEIKLIKLEASEGMAIYNIENPEVYGKIFYLGINDSPENWAEREETIVELNPVPELVEGPNS